ncbi:MULTISPECIES: DUF2892 domain-containing protein [unclassified Arthrobacter]|uniref:YgaP family membrane protein n=1 Tax=unclassified Arthrobacter TaxID=235627 RepID=UPI0002F41D42|nr:MULTISPECIES: DUF2892 domain-containing protein [unclassified Arthrobacter]PVE19566.1 DUF2892 domain-containing protein [Arthrobacter sp. Bz4]
MEFVKFMRSSSGRILRITAGVVLALVGVFAVEGAGGIALVLVGFVMIAAGVVNFCLLGPLFHTDVWGNPKRTSERA